MMAAQCLHLTHFLNNTITVWKPGRTENSCFDVKVEREISLVRTSRCQNVKIYKAWLTSWKTKYVSSFLSSYGRCSRRFCTMTKFFLYQERHRTGERNRWFCPVASFGLFFTALMELLSRTVISVFFFLLFCGPGGIEGHVEQHLTQVWHDAQQAGPAEQAVLQSCGAWPGLSPRACRHSLSRPDNNFIRTQKPLLYFKKKSILAL